MGRRGDCLKSISHFKIEKSNCIIRSDIQWETGTDVDLIFVTAVLWLQILFIIVGRGLNHGIKHDNNRSGGSLAGVYIQIRICEVYTAKVGLSGGLGISELSVDGEDFTIIKFEIYLT